MRLPDVNLRAEYKQAKRALFQRVLGQFQGGWNKRDHLGIQHTPQLSGRLAIANLLDTMSLPCGYSVVYKGTHRSSGLGGHGIEDGELQYQVTVNSRSGAKHFIDVPLVVRAGQVETPSVMYYNNQPMIIAQSSFNRIIEAAEFKEKLPDRSNMYSLPNGKVEGEVYRWQRGIRASADAVKLQAVARSLREELDAVSARLNALMKRAMSYAREHVTSPEQAADLASLLFTDGGVASAFILDQARQKFGRFAWEPTHQKPKNAEEAELLAAFQELSADEERVDAKAREIFVPVIQDYFDRAEVEEAKKLWQLMPEGAAKWDLYRVLFRSKQAQANADTEGGGEVLPPREEVMREFAPTGRVKLTREFVYIGRGGQRFHMDKGSKGTVVRVTTEGVLVAFDGSFTVQVPADALS